MAIGHGQAMPIRGVMIPGPESDFYHFSEIDDSDSNYNSNSSKNRFSYCTGIDSGYWNRFRVLESIPKWDIYIFPIPEKTRNFNTSNAVPNGTAHELFTELLFQREPINTIHA